MPSAEGPALEAILDVLAPHMTGAVVQDMHEIAEHLYPILVSMDASVGVVSSKIYDAKLVISAIARRVASLPYAAWGLAPDGCGVANDKLLFEVMLAFMSVHRASPDDLHGAARQVLRAVPGSAPFRRTLFVCDAGTDPNEDDIAAAQILINYNLLATGAIRR